MFGLNEGNVDVDAIGVADTRNDTDVVDSLSTATRVGVVANASPFPTPSDWRARQRWIMSPITLIGLATGSGNVPLDEVGMLGAISSSVITSGLNGTTPVTRNAIRMLAAVRALT